MAGKGEIMNQSGRNKSEWGMRKGMNQIRMNKERKKSEKEE